MRERYILTISKTKARIVLQRFNHKLLLVLSDNDIESLSRDEQKRRYRAVLDLIRNTLLPLLNIYNEEAVYSMALTLVNQTPYFKGVESTRINKLAANLLDEVKLIAKQRDYTVRVSRDKLLVWYYLCCTVPLSRTEATLLLSLLWAESITRKNTASQAYLVKISGLSVKKVKEKLKGLRERKLLSYTIGKYKSKTIKSTFYTKKIRKGISRWEHNLSFGSGCLPNAFFNGSDVLDKLEEIDYIGYCEADIANVSNPFASISQEFVNFHKGVFSPELLMVSILSEDHFTFWLGKVMNRPKDGANTILRKTEKKLISVLDATIISSDEHFRQIERVLPILRYIGTRSFEVNWPVLHEQLSYNLWKLQVAQDSVINTQSGALLPSVGYDGLYHFLECLEKPEPGTHWRKKYPNSRLTLTPASVEAWVSTQNDGLIELDPNWEWEGLKEMIPTLLSGSDILEIRRTSNLIAQLLELKERLDKDQSFSLKFVPRVIEVITHAIFFVSKSPQNIKKSLRNFIIARPGYHLIWVDIDQMHTQILEAIARQQNLIKDAETIDFLQISKRVGVSRKQVKAAFYPRLNGAGIRKMSEESGLDMKKTRLLSKEFTKNLYYESYCLWAEQYTRKNGATPPSALGYEIPLNKEYWLAPGYLIQITAHEILRAWVLKLHEHKISSHIINLLHDEVVFEVPANMNLYVFAEKVQKDLQDASQALLPGIELTVKANAGRSWIKNQAIDIATSKGNLSSTT